MIIVTHASRDMIVSDSTLLRAAREGRDMGKKAAMLFDKFDTDHVQS